MAGESPNQPLNLIQYEFETIHQGWIFKENTHKNK